ncbi:unnamed protein product [Ceutorhynchus assimilis]|uniref:Uncharacterized protein n=1 Tax=Ceutorhynchus assimilis TaxID=467358 RepID=A0A9N9MGF7_9CUCU|nr:unnamed protein product [Ceutorhynchus assimilis]
MPKGKGTWHTPLASMKNREEVMGRIENKGWKTEKMSLKPEITYFNTVSSHVPLSLYDQYFASTKTFPLWDPKKPKDNSKYLPKIREYIYKQEKNKPVPALTSYTYGLSTLTFYDEIESAFKRSCATNDFYRRRGVMDLDEKDPLR